ncbi:MAG: PD-(D/E)XK nuclease family protein [Gemmatimonadaceae bacterium]
MIRVVRSLNLQSLLEAAASEFLTCRPATGADAFPTPAAWLAVRQGGIRDDLLRLAHERGIPGWFDPPLCVFAELPDILADLSDRPIDDFERMVILRSLIDGLAPQPEILGAKHGTDYLDSIDRLFGELLGEGIGADDLDRALSHVEGRDGFEKKRDAELSALFRAYQLALAEANARDPRARLVDCAAAITADPAQLSHRLGGRRAIRLYGLADLRGGWRALLRALETSPAVDDITIYTSVDLPLRDIPARVEILHELESLAERLFTDGAEPLQENVQLISAPDTQREVEEIARRVRMLIDAGTKPHHIAIITRQARPCVDLACDALDRVGVPATARRRHAYTEVPLVRAVLSLLDAAADGWSRHGLAALARQPYIGSALDATVLNFVGFRQRVRGLAEWELALRALEGKAMAREQGEPDEEAARRYPLPPHERVVEAREALSSFASHARHLDRARTLAEWLAWLGDTLTQDAFHIEERIYAIPPDRYQVARIDLRAWDALTTVTRDWREALEKWNVVGEPMTVSEFAEQLREMFAADLTIWTQTLRGVQVLEALSGAYRAFDHVFLVGMEAGRFPTRPPRSPLWHDADRERLVAAGLGLDSPDVWAERERELFRVLVAGAASLTISYPRSSAREGDSLPSAFVEAVRECCTVTEEVIPTARVLTPGLPLHREPESVAHARRVAEIEHSRHTGAPSPYNGIITDAELLAWLGIELGDDRLWSPTQIESYAKCPWAYLAARLLKLDERGDPDEDMEPTTRGTILHDALRRFFESAEATLGAPVYLRPENTDLMGEPLERALDEAIATAGEREWLGAPALRSARRDELLRLLRGVIEYEITYNEQSSNNRTNSSKAMRAGVIAHELAFDDVVLERGGIRFRFRGSIDRVERGVDGRITGADQFVAAVDYKSTIYSTPGSGKKEAWDDRVVLQVPLYAYALERLYPGSRVARVEYRALKDPKAVHQLQPVGVNYKTGAISENADAAARLDGALDAVVAHVRAAREGNFSTAPAPSCGCPPYCAGWDICRVAGGPKGLRDL